MLETQEFATEQKTSVITQLANKYDIPAPVIEVICNSPFKFANRVIVNPEDTKPIMFAYLFKLKLKSRLVCLSFHEAEYEMHFPYN